MIMLIIIRMLILMIITQNTDPDSVQEDASEGDVARFRWSCSTFIRATQVRAYDDRASDFLVGNSYVSTLCPVVICPDLCTSEFRRCLKTQSGLSQAT